MPVAAPGIPMPPAAMLVRGATHPDGLRVQSSVIVAAEPARRALSEALAELVDRLHCVARRLGGDLAQIQWRTRADRPCRAPRRAAVGAPPQTPRSRVRPGLIPALGYAP